MRAEAARRQQESSEDPDFGPWLAQPAILVIDDGPGMRNFLVRTLWPRCKRVEQAAYTEEALPRRPITDAVRTALARYDWPGNVRELRNLIDRSLILGAFPTISAGMTSPAFSA